MSENPIIQYIRLTVIPCFARLFSRRRLLSSLCLCFTLLICAVLLSALCLTFGQNLTSLDSFSAEFDTYITTHGVNAGNRAFRESVRTVLTYAQAEVYVTHVCFVGLWLVTALAAVYRVFTESVATEKYVYALYIIYGADTKLLRKGIIREFWILGLPAILLSLPLGLWLTRDSNAVSGFSFLWVAEMLISFFLLSLLCARQVTRKLFKESCVSLMTAIDTSEYIQSPRRISLKKTLRRRSGFGYALLSFGRMKKYRFIHALSIALIGAVLFSMTALTLPDNYAVGDSTHEYTLTFRDGVSFDTLETDYLPALESLEAVVSTRGQAADTAERIGTHLMLLPNQVNDSHHASLLHQEDKWAMDTVKIACGDGVTDMELGEQTVVIPDKFKGRPLEEIAYTLDPIKAGEAVYVYPQQNGAPQIQIGDTVEIAIPDGVEGYDRYGDHITLTVSRLVPVGLLYTQKTLDFPFIEPVCPRIFEDYLFLSLEDYGLISNTVQTESLNVSETYPEELSLSPGSCYVVFPTKMKKTHHTLSHLTVITPPREIKKPYTSWVETDGIPPELPTDTYYINQTAPYSGIYFGKASDCAASEQAISAMQSRMHDVLDTTQGEVPIMTQYRIEGRTYSDDIAFPCVIFVHGDGISLATFATELSAMTLQPSDTADKALYWLDREVLVLSPEQDQSLPARQQMHLTTDLPEAFITAMEKAGVPLPYPREDCQLTSCSTVTSFREGTQSFLLLSPSTASLPMVANLPLAINGQGSYRPVGDVNVDSIITLSDIDSMLVFHGDPKEQRSHAMTLQGDLATNDFTLMTEKEAELPQTLNVGEVILRLPAAHPYALTVGDSIYGAITQPLTLDLTQMDLKGRDLLAYQISRLDHSYLPLTLTAVETDSSLSSPILICSEDTFATLCARSGVVSALEVFVQSHVSLEDLSEVAVCLQSLTADGITVTPRDAVLRSQGTGSQRYPALLQRMILPLSALIPLLILSSAYTLYLRREKERSSYTAAGEHRTMHTLMTLGEGLLSCLLSGGLYAFLCPLAILILKLFCGKFHVPLAPNSFAFIPFLLILGLILTTHLCLSLCALLPSGSRTASRKVKKGGISS